MKKRMGGGEGEKEENDAAGGMPVTLRGLRLGKYELQIW